MTAHRAHEIWHAQCDAARTIRARYGLQAAFDYIVGEKLLNFAEAAVRHPDFARELPKFVSEVRSMFTADEIGTHLARIERQAAAADVTEADEDEDESFRESPTEAAERVERFLVIRELLTAATLGTS
jgi:hypothetical protein